MPQAAGRTVLIADVAKLPLYAAATGHGGNVGWPRVHADCDYRAPLRFEDRFEIRLLVRERRERSITYAFQFRKLNAQTAVDVARGALTVACVRFDEAGKLSSVPIPAEIASVIEAASPELLAQ